MLHTSESKHKESTDTCDYKRQLLKTRHRVASIARRHTASAQCYLPSCLCTWLLPDHMLSQPPSQMKRYLGKCICCPQLAQFWPPICLGGDAWSHLCILIGPCRPYHDLSHAPHGSTNCHCSYVYYTAGDIQQAQADTTQETAAVRQTCKQYIPGKAGAAALELGHHLLPCQGLICSYFLSIMADRELQHTCPDSAASCRL